MSHSHRRLKTMIPVEDDEALARLLGCLQQAGYDEDWATQVARPMAHIPPRLMLAALLKQCQDSSAVNLLARLWAFSQWVEEVDLLRVLPQSLLDRLLHWGLLVRRQTRLAATVDLCPVQGLWLASDRTWGLGLDTQAVYPPGLDSYAMCRWTPRWSQGTALDLGTGSGIQALATAGGCQRVEGFDISQRAIDFATFNARLNGRPATFHRSDLYSASAGRRYDLIVSNPPWVPAPPGDIHLYRGGGASGEVLVERICRGLGQHLADRGRAALYVEYPQFQGQSYLDRMRDWLGGGNWGLALLHRRHYSLLEYVAGHTADHLQPEIDFEAWYRSYCDQGIVGVSAGLLLILRLPTGHPGWALQRDGDFPHSYVGESVKAWLEQGRLSHAPDYRPDLEAIPGRVGDFGVLGDPRGGSVRLEWPQGTFASQTFEGPAAQFLASLDQQRSADQIAQDLGWSSAQLQECLHPLCQQGVLRACR